MLNTLASARGLNGMKSLSLPMREVHAASVAASSDTGDGIRRHLHGVWRYLRMHGAAPHEADDLVQEAFVVAVQKGALALEPAATAAFLRRTARFLFLRSRRDAREAIALADSVDELWDRDCAADDGDGLLERLRECVQRLPERSRRAVELGYGLHADEPARRGEMAAALGLQANGVKTLMQRVRAWLRTCIERRGP